MIRNLKALGLAVMALLVLGVVGAPTASAQNGEISAEGATTTFTLTGTETGAGANRLTAFGSRVECPDSSYTGHTVLTHTQTTEGKEHDYLHDGESTATITPHYATTCHATALKFPTTVTMNGCDYVFHLEGTTDEVNTYGVKATLDCPEGNKPEVEIYKLGAAHTSENLKCILTVDPNEEGYEGLHATDTTNGHIDLTGTVEGIKVTQEEGPAKGCLSGITTDNNGKLDIDVSVTAHDEDGNPVGIGISHG